MDAKALLEELFQQSKSAATKGVSLAEESLGVPEEGEARDQMISGMTKGALAAGAIALLLGTKGGRSLTGTAVKIGSVAAVGGLAYKAYNNWQSSQNGQTISHSGKPDQAIDSLEGDTQNNRSVLLIRAMIAAAQADGHLDETEKSNIKKQIENFGLDTSLERFLINEMSQPLDIDGLAEKIQPGQECAELYLASAMVIDVDQPEERAYLDKLASALKLDPGLAQALEHQIRQA